MDFAGVKALSFDCYGTLIDWETGITGELRRNPALARLDDEVLLAAHAKHETQVQSERPEEPYRVLLREVYLRICRDLGASATEEQARHFGDSVGEWPPFDDSGEALRRLAERFLLCVLSNVDVDSLGRSQKQLGFEFPVVVTAQEVGAYKPDRRMFDTLRERLDAKGVAPREHVHVAQSLFHDHVPAKRIGLSTVWVDRRAGAPGGATPEASEVQPDLTVASMEDLTRLIA